MAKNREPQPKPAESEQTDDDDLVSDSGSESGSDDEQETPPPPPHKPAIPSPNPPPAVSNSSESLSDSGSDSDPTPPKPDPTPKSKPTPVKPSAAGVKRPSGKVTEVQDSKKAKKAESLLKKDLKPESASTGDDISKNLFARIFSEDDEIILLKGMLDFISKKKSDPVAEVDAFLDFIKKFKLLHVDVTRAQLLNKMRRLKGKYQSNASKFKDGNEKKFSKEHERETYALSKSIWGGVEGESNSVGGGVEGKGNGSVMKKCVNKNVGRKVLNEVEGKVVVGVKEESGQKKVKDVGGSSSSGVMNGVDRFNVYYALEKRVMSEEIDNLDKQKQKELEKKWKEIEVAELQLFAKRCEYMAEKARLIIAAKKA